jgi:surface antigen-like variable number repeat protein
LVLLGALAAFFLPTLLAAQIPRRLKRCLPYPTLSDELCEMAGQNCNESERPGLSVFIDSVKLVGGDSLPLAVRRQVVHSVKPKQGHPGPFNENWLREVEEVGFRGALQDAGYFRPIVEAEGQILESDAISQHVAITVHIKEGPRYRLDSIQFRPASESTPLAFSFEILRRQVSLQDGAFFDVSKIRDGLESLTRLYGARGYIDFTAEAQTEIHDKSGTISLVIVLSPERQYRIGKVEVWGPDPASEKLLQSYWKAGDIFNTEQLEGFFRENKTKLPADAAREDLTLSRHVREGTVDMKFDFRVCPQPPI